MYHQQESASAHTLIVATCSYFGLVNALLGGGNKRFHWSKDHTYLRGLSYLGTSYWPSWDHLESD